jgi:hypothetical protein
MADSDKNILITPNKGQSSLPTIAITGEGNDPIIGTVPDNAYPSIDFKNSSGDVVLSLDDNTSDGSVFSVSDIDSKPLIDVGRNNSVTLNGNLEFGGSGPVLPQVTSSGLPSPETGLITCNKTDSTISSSDGTSWTNCSIENSIVENGLVLHLDSFDRRSYSSGTTWTDLTGIHGGINVQNRSTDWSFQTEPVTGKTCLYNATNRSTSSGINIPTNLGFNKMSGTIEMWLKPGDLTGAHGWFVNADGSTLTNANGWLWFGGWDTNSIAYFRASTSTTCCSDNALGGWSTNWYRQDKWVNVAVSWNFNLGFVRSTIVANGVVARRGSHLTNIENFSPSATGQLFNGHNRGDNMQFKGYCSEYRIYNRELSIEELWNNYKARKNRYDLGSF